MPGFLRTASRPSNLPSSAAPYFLGASGVGFNFSSTSKTFFSDINNRYGESFRQAHQVQKRVEKSPKKGNLYFRFFWLENTISCGQSSVFAQYLGVCLVRITGPLTRSKKGVAADVV